MLLLLPLQLLVLVLHWMAATTLFLIVSRKVKLSWVEESWSDTHRESSAMDEGTNEGE